VRYEAQVKGGVGPLVASALDGNCTLSHSDSTCLIVCPAEPLDVAALVRFLDRHRITIEHIRVRHVERRTA